MKTFLRTSSSFFASTSQSYQSQATFRTSNPMYFTLYLSPDLHFPEHQPFFCTLFFLHVLWIILDCEFLYLILRFFCYCSDEFYLFPTGVWFWISKTFDLCSIIRLSLIFCNSSLCWSLIFLFLQLNLCLFFRLFLFLPALVLMHFRPLLLFPCILHIQWKVLLAYHFFLYTLGLNIL